MPQLEAISAQLPSHLRPTGLPIGLREWLDANNRHPCWHPKAPQILNHYLGAGYVPLRWRELVEVLGEDSSDLLTFQEERGFVTRGAEILTWMPKDQWEQRQAVALARSKAMEPEKYHRKALEAELNEAGIPATTDDWDADHHRGIDPQVTIL